MIDLIPETCWTLASIPPVWSPPWIHQVRNWSLPSWSQFGTKESHCSQYKSPNHHTGHDVAQIPLVVMETAVPCDCFLLIGDWWWSSRQLTRSRSLRSAGLTALCCGQGQTSRTHQHEGRRKPRMFKVRVDEDRDGTSASGDLQSPAGSSTSNPFISSSLLEQWVLTVHKPPSSQGHRQLRPGPAEEICDSITCGNNREER